MYLLGVIFLSDEVNDCLCELRSGRGVLSTRIVQLQSGLSYLLLQHQVKLLPHFLEEGRRVGEGGRHTDSCNSLSA